jgi:hypothetical protein
VRLLGVRGVDQRGGQSGVCVCAGRRGPPSGTLRKEDDVLMRVGSARCPVMVAIMLTANANTCSRWGAILTLLAVDVGGCAWL